MKMTAPVFCTVCKNITKERSLPDPSELCIRVTSGLKDVTLYCKNIMCYYYRESSALVMAIR